MMFVATMKRSVIVGVHCIHTHWAKSCIFFFFVFTIPGSKLSIATVLLYFLKKKTLFSSHRSSILNRSRDSISGTSHLESCLLTVQSGPWWLGSKGTSHVPNLIAIYLIVNQWNLILQNCGKQSAVAPFFSDKDANCKKVEQTSMRPQQTLPLHYVRQHL